MKEYLIPKSTINLVYVSKDKIRNKIKEYEKSDKEYAIQGNYENEISVLEDLLNSF